MNPEQLRDLVRYRLEQASETLAEAVLLRDAGAFRGAVNRAYLRHVLCAAGTAGDPATRHVEA